MMLVMLYVLQTSTAFETAGTIAASIVVQVLAEGRLFLDL